MVFNWILLAFCIILLFITFKHEILLVKQYKYMSAMIDVLKMLEGDYSKLLEIVKSVNKEVTLVSDLHDQTKQVVSFLADRVSQDEDMMLKLGNALAEMQETAKSAEQ